MRWQFSALVAFIAAAAFLSWPTSSVSAATYGYEAQAMIRSAQVLEIAPGGTADFTIGFKNVSTSTWRSSGDRFVSVYTYEPKYRDSAFKDVSWFASTQPTKVSGDAVAPGQIGMFRFRLRAPATEGDYHETFQLAAESLLWIPGGGFAVDIKVRKPAAVVSSPIVTTSTTTASRSSYSALEIRRSADVVRLNPGESTIFSVDFRNTGSVTWLPDGRNFVSIYTYDPKYRKSAFEDISWYSPEQPARISTLSTPPGQFGTVSFRLKAPTAPGTYQETFHLAAEDLAWIAGGQFTVRIEVGGGSSASVVATPTPQPETAPTPVVQNADGYAATKMISSGDRLAIAASALQEYRVAFKNMGVIPWVKYGSEPVRLRAVSDNALSFRDSTWDGDFPAPLSQDRVDSGQLAFFNVKLRAPQSGGLFYARFALYAGDQPVEGGTVEVPVEVTGGSVSPIATPSAASEFSNSGSRGPNIRVGLFTTTSPVVLAAIGTYQLIDGRDNTPVRQLSGVTTVTYDFSASQYTVTNGSFVYTSGYHVHLRPDDSASTIFEISSYENRAAWDTSVNQNKFRGDIAVHYMLATGNLWVIEELPIEDYLRGLAETSNASPQEYQRALVTAARTYALYVLSIGGKHKAEYHDVNCTAGDQVYKGYVSELVRPNVVQAVEDTRGSVVTYNGEMVVTPYFSRSDGRTRAWSEVWGGGTKPWLVSVPTPYDQGKTLWGHGVGLAASDAVGRARDGASWTDILRYYYTGTEVRRIY